MRLRSSARVPVGETLARACLFPSAESSDHYDGGQRSSSMGLKFCIGLASQEVEQFVRRIRCAMRGVAGAVPRPSAARKKHGRAGAKSVGLCDHGDVSMSMQPIQDSRVLPMTGPRRVNQVHGSLCCSGLRSVGLHSTIHGGGCVAGCHALQLQTSLIPWPGRVYEA